MAAPYNPPKKGEDFLTYISLADMSVPGSYKINPTIAASDFKISKDGGALAALTSTPVVEPTTSALVRLWLSGTEMAADNIAVIGVDQTSPKEWSDFVLSIPTVTSA
jgi:hypothetical protein